jgi:hypothetical protein
MKPGLIKVPNNIIPFSGYTAMTIWPFLFIRKENMRYVDNYTMNHERIHAVQQIENLIVVFFIVYILESIIKGYRNISFEIEAYKHDRQLSYLEERPLFASYKYLFKKAKK